MADRLSDLGLVLGGDEGVDAGEWLIERAADADRGQCRWLLILAEFDLVKGWKADGQLSCAEWLQLRTRLSRAAAYEKLQVAHQLRRRPILADAFAEGRVSYSAVRAIARLEDPDPEVEEALIAAAEAGTVTDVERLVRAYLAHADQHRPPDNLHRSRGVRVKTGFDGTTVVEITLGHVEAQELLASIDAYTAGLDADPGQPSDESTRVDTSESEGTPGDESTRVDSGKADLQSWPGKRADAVMAMARSALAHIKEGQASGDDRYLVHIISHAGEMALLDGTPIDPATAARIACDHSSVKALLGTDWEPLAMGRKTKHWTTAQRRAARIRDGGRCRFPGCDRRYVDLHHHRHWEHGGTTDLSNGFLLCPRHHTLLHKGYSATGDPNGRLTFHRPDGSPVGTSRISAPWTPARS